MLLISLSMLLIATLIVTSTTFLIVLHSLCLCFELAAQETTVTSTYSTRRQVVDWVVETLFSNSKTLFSNSKTLFTNSKTLFTNSKTLFTNSKTLFSKNKHPLPGVSVAR